MFEFLRRGATVHPYVTKYSRRWPVVLPIYDGRQCPECHVPIIGHKARTKHTRMHEAKGEWDEYVHTVLAKLCEVAGMRMMEPEEVSNARREINEGDYESEDE